uniref:Uncharacterized protein n=2 Tax=Oryza TaxID=4527 RepID=A0A0E0NSM4_ORYRU
MKLVRRYEIGTASIGAANNLYWPSAFQENGKMSGEHSNGSPINEINKILERKFPTINLIPLQA